MEAVARGRIERLAELYERHKSPLLGFLMNRTGRNRPVAEDLLHAVFERVIRYRRSWQPGQTFRTWLYAIARNACHDHLRREGRMPLDDEVEWDSVPNPSAEAAVDCRRAIEALPENYRVVVELAWQRQMKYAEIATVLGTTENNIKVRMHRATRYLRKHYRKVLQQ